MWTQGCCPMLAGVRLQYGNTRPGMSILRVTYKALETVKRILAGALPNQHPAKRLQDGESKGPCQHGKTKLQEVEEVRTAGTMVQTAVTHGATT